MSGLIGGLLQNTRSLAVHSQQVQTAGKNLANVNNPNYARQRVITGNAGTYTAGGLGPQSLGLEAQGVEHIRDRILDAQLVREMQARSELEARHQAMNWLETNFGESLSRLGGIDEERDGPATAGLGKVLDEFFASWEAVAANPADGSERAALLHKASELAERFNNLDGRLADVDSQIVAQVGDDSERANRLLADIADLNNEIQRYEIRDQGQAVDLRDQRQGKLEELAELVNFETRELPGSHGQIEAYTTEAGTSNEVLLVHKGNVINEFQYDGASFTASDAGVPLAVTAGSLAGYHDVHSGELANLRGEVDALARQLVASVNAAYNPLGNPGENFFNPAGLDAGSIAVDPALDLASFRLDDGTGGASANDYALVAASLVETSFSTGGGDLIDGTFGEHYQRLATVVGQGVQASEQALENQTAIENFLREQRESVSGVSIDEEMTDLLRFQRAFQASSRVVSILDSMLDRVVNGLVR